MNSCNIVNMTNAFIVNIKRHLFAKISTNIKCCVIRQQDYPKLGVYNFPT